MRRSSLCRKCFNSLMALWVAFAWNGPLFAATVEQETARASKYVTQLQRSLMAIEDGRREAPRDRWDPQYVVDTVGIDPAKLYGFIRDNVGWVPYRGTLRGPVGVLMDRRGNALDQSLLLAKLLSLAGHETRLARAELPETAAGSLWASLAASASPGDAASENADGDAPASAETTTEQSPPATAADEAVPGSPATSAPPTPGLLFSATPDASSDAPPSELAEVYELDGATVETTLKEASDSRTDLARELESRVVTQGVRLLSQFGSGDATAQRDYEQGRAFSALRDHWWVQINQGGNWIDYDLMSPDGQPGKALASTSATMSADAVPDDQRHRVLLRVVAEQLKNGALTETAILEHAFDPKELFGKRISLRHVPMMWPADWAAITSEDVQEKLFAALMTQREWMPALTVGGEAFQQGSVRDSGDLNPDPKPKSNPFLALTFPAAGKVGRVADIFDDLLEQAAPEGGGNAPPGDAVRAEGELTAEWLEFTILVPGEQPKVVRRELFDILGPATRSSGDFSNFRMDDDKRLARAAGQMIETEILIQPSWPASEFIADLTAQLALTNKPVLDEFARDPFGKAPPNSMELFSKMQGIAGPAYLYSMLRSEVVMTSPSVFVDRPQVVAQHSMLTRAAPGELTSRTALDVVENGIGVDPFGPDAFSVRLLQGIADTNAEALALGEEGRRNVGEAFAQTIDNEDWTVLFPGDENKVESLGLAPDLAARIRADLAAGYAVVSPPGTAPAAQRAGWWRIDPSTGATLGLGEQGWGAVLVEYAFYLTVQAMLAEIACMATAASEEERLRGIGAEEARQKVKAWARQCVSQALLQSITGMSTAWIENRFIHGASTRSLSRASGARPSAPRIPRGSARPQSTAGHAPHPSGPRAPSAPRSPAPGPSSTAPHASGTSPSSAAPSAPRSPAASTSSSGSSSSSQSRPQSSAPKPPPDMRKAPEAQKSAPKPPGDADHAVKSHTERHVEARRLEQEAAQKYRQNPTPENLKNYETAEAKARDARWSELNEYAKNGGRGLPPGLRPKGQQSAPAGSGPVSGTAPTQPGLPPTQRPASGTAPTQPGVPPTQRPTSGTAPTQPGVPPTQRSPAAGDHAAPTQHSPSPMAESVPPPRGPASGPASGTAPTQPGAPPTQRSPSRADHAPPTQHSPSPMAESVPAPRGSAKSPAAESVPPPRGAPGPVSRTAPTQPGLPPTQRPASGTAPTQPGLPPTQRPASGTAPTQPGVPPTQRPASGTAPTQPGVPPTQRPASGTAPTQPGVPPTQRPASGTAPTQPGVPPTQRPAGNTPPAQKPPMTPADQRVQPHTERHLEARRQEIEAAKRLQQNPTEANRKAYEAAEAATKDAAFAEQAEYRRQGGEGLPPGLRPGAREALPGTPGPSPMAESVARPQSPAPGPATQQSPSPMAESVPPPQAPASGPATQPGIGRAPTGTLPGVQPGLPPAQRGAVPPADNSGPSTLRGVRPRAGPLGTAPTQPRLPPMQQMPAGRAGTPPSGPASASADTVKGGKPDTLREPFGRSPDTQRLPSPMAESVPPPPNTVRTPSTQRGVGNPPAPTTLPGVGPSPSARSATAPQARPLGAAPARTAAADKVPPTQRSPGAPPPQSGTEPPAGPLGTAPTQPGLPPTQRPANGTAPTQPGLPPTQRPASGTAQTEPGLPPTQRPASGTAPTQPGEPPTPRAQAPRPPMTPADQAVQSHTDRHLEARRQEIEAAKRLQQDPTDANRQAYAAAEAATKDAAFAEQAEYRRQGGEGLPPGLRPGVREPLPGTPAPSPAAESVPAPPASPISPAAASVPAPAPVAEASQQAERTNIVRSAPDTIPDYGGDTLQAEAAPAPAGPSSTLSMGLGALGSTIKFGP